MTCRDCGQEMAAGSLDSHRMTQHGKARERGWAWTDAATGGKSKRLTGWSFQREGQRTAQSKGARGGRGRGRRCACTSEEGTCGTLSSSWRRETYPTPGARTATCWCRGGPLTGATRIQRCAGAEQNGNGGGLQKRRSGRERRGPLRPTGTKLSRSPGK